MTEEMTSENMMPEVHEAEMETQKEKKKPKKKPIDKLSPKQKADLVADLEKLIKNDKKIDSLRVENDELYKKVKEVLKVDLFDYQSALLKVLKMV